MQYSSKLKNFQIRNNDLTIVENKYKLGLPQTLGNADNIPHYLVVTYERKHVNKSWLT